MFHAGFFRQVLADKAVGVFISAPFPRMVRSSKETFDRSLSLYFLVAVELSPVVKGNGNKLTFVLLDGLDASLRDQKRGSS